MNVITPDIPVMVIGIAVLFWAHVRQPRYVFHMLGQFFSTFAGGFAWGVVWSLGGRVIPIWASVLPTPLANSTLRAYTPFAVWVVGITLLLSQRWPVPAGVSPFYGEYRVAVQIVVFLSAVFSTMWLAGALRHRKAPALLFDLLTAAVLIHSLASVYTLVADRFGLPIIGIARAQEDIVDVAAFATGDRQIMRPSGLAGEPKTAAVIFGTYLLMRIFGNFRAGSSKLRSVVETVTLALGSFAFLMTWSTSAFLGAGAAAVALILRFPESLRGVIVRLAAVAFLASALWSFSSEDLDLGELIRMRTVDRVSTESKGMDPPVAASLDAIQNDMSIAAFGTGLGGSAFVIARYLGVMPKGAWSANIMIVLFWVELGLVGLILMLGPSAALFFSRIPPPHTAEGAASRLYLVLGFGMLVICMAGSGIGMGLNLAFAALAASRDIAVQGFYEEAP